MSYKKNRAGIEAWWNEKIKKGSIKARTQEGNSMLRGNMCKGSTAVCQNC